MNTSLFEMFKKITSVTVICTLVFSFVSPAFAASNTNMTTLSAATQVPAIVTAGVATASITYVVTINRTDNGASNPIAMSVTGLPVWASQVSFPSPSFSGNNTTTTANLTLQTTSAAVAGVHNFTIQAVSGNTIT